MAKLKAAVIQLNDAIEVLTSGKCQDSTDFNNIMGPKYMWGRPRLKRLYFLASLASTFPKLKDWLIENDLRIKEGIKSGIGIRLHTPVFEVKKAIEESISLIKCVGRTMARHRIEELLIRCPSGPMADMIQAIMADDESGAMEAMHKDIELNEALDRLRLILN